MQHSYVSCVGAAMDITAQEAYQEAMTDIFEAKAEVHRFIMPNISRKQPSKIRWTLFEMWPINVSSPGLEQVTVLSCACPAWWRNYASSSAL